MTGTGPGTGSKETIGTSDFRREGLTGRDVFLWCEAGLRSPVRGIAERPVWGRAAAKLIKPILHRKPERRAQPIEGVHRRDGAGEIDQAQVLCSEGSTCRSGIPPLRWIADDPSSDIRRREASTQSAMRASWPRWLPSAGPPLFALLPSAWNCLNPLNVGVVQKLAPGGLITGIHVNPAIDLYPIGTVRHPLRAHASAVSAPRYVD